MYILTDVSEEITSYIIRAGFSETSVSIIPEDARIQIDDEILVVFVDLLTRNNTALVHVHSELFL